MTASRGPIAIEVIDSHTAGEPTRLVIEGGPDLGTGPLAERLERFREHFDRYRSAIVNEPRGSDTLVGVVNARLHADGRIDVENVTSYRKARHLRVPVGGVGSVLGDIACVRN